MRTQYVQWCTYNVKCVDCSPCGSRSLVGLAELEAEARQASSKSGSEVGVEWSVLLLSAGWSRAGLYTSRSSHDGCRLRCSCKRLVNQWSHTDNRDLT